MGTYGRVRREKRACLGNDSGARGAPWTHKIVTICVTFLRARGQSCGAKHLPDALFVMCKMCALQGSQDAPWWAYLGITQRLIARQESHPAVQGRKYQGR